MVLNTDLKVGVFPKGGGSVRAHTLICHSPQEIMMDHSLRSISYIADIGDLLVIMARRRLIPNEGEDVQVSV